MGNLEEIWKPVKDFEDYYEVSDLGRIRTVERVLIQSTRSYLKKSQYLKLTPSDKGYIKVKLYNGRTFKSLTVHQIVAINFIDNPNNLIEINHKDAIKSNNKKNNLEWCTRGENIEHCYKNGLKDPKTYKGEGNKKAKLTDDIVRKIRTKYTKGGYTYKFFAKKYNVGITTIGYIINKKIWNHV